MKYELSKYKLNLPWVQWSCHGADDSRIQIDSSEAASHAGLWFSAVEPEACKLCRSRSSWNVVSYYWKGAWSQEVLRWASVYLGCRVVPVGLESAVVEVPEATQRTCNSYVFSCCCWQWVTGKFLEHPQLFGGSLFKEDFNLVWTSIDTTFVTDFFWEEQSWICEELCKTFSAVFRSRWKSQQSYWASSERYWGHEKCCHCYVKPW